MANKQNNSNKRNTNNIPKTENRKKNTDNNSDRVVENKEELEAVINGGDNTGIDDIDEFDSMLDALDAEIKEDESIREIEEIKEIDISRKIDKRDEVVVKNLRRVISNKRKEEVETTTLEDIKKNKVLWIILGVLFVILIITLIVTNIPKKEKNTDNPKKTTTVIETTTPKEEDELVAEPENSEITELIKNFLKAQRIDVSIDEVSKYVDNAEKISVAEYEKLKKYIEEFQNVTCYKLNSTVENTYIVITTYGCKFYNIETAAPGFEAFMVVYKDGKYLVHNLTIEENLDTYISRDVDVAKINKLMKEINDSLENAKELDADLAAVMNELSSIENNNSTKATSDNSQ